MRLWTERCWLVWFVAVGAALAVACGGSASETPEPVRPDSWQLKLRHQQQVSAAKDEEPQRALNRPENFDDPATARSTWGNVGAKPRPLPHSPSAPVEQALAPAAPAPSAIPVQAAAKVPASARQKAPKAPPATPTLPKTQPQSPAD